VDECVSWTPPATFELTGRDGRLIRYCGYGPRDGFPVVSHSGSPATRWKRPVVIEAIEQAGLRLLVPDRPGYGGSARQRGRSVADAAQDAALLADAQGWAQFAVTGTSGGGPHALACAAQLAGRVTRCAVASGISPPDTSGPLSPDPAHPRRNKTSWLAARGEDAVRPHLAAAAREIMARVEAGGPEMPPDPAAPEPGPPALGDPAAMARLRATFAGSHDGWVDDNIAFARPWGFEFSDIAVPVSIWYGTHDATGRAHADWLLSRIPAAARYEYPGGHIPGDSAYRRILAWLRG
jgi:pimeloyl-ACP methyl ester carboxylesterase